ncbi:MAG: ABC transporter ATP-binding protein, partial [Micromonosporaceae bacterium]
MSTTTDEPRDDPDEQRRGPPLRDVERAPSQADINVTDWRGQAAEEDAERTAAEGTDARSVIRLQGRSRLLLRSLLRPHRRLITWAIVLLLAQNAAAMAGP